MGVETIGWALARGANRFVGGWIQTLFDKPWYFLDAEKQAGRMLGLALAADEAGPQWLLSRLKVWDGAGVSAPSLLDLASDAYNLGTNTRYLLKGASQRQDVAGNKAADYRDFCEGNIFLVVDRCFDTLSPPVPALIRLFDAVDGAPGSNDVEAEAAWYAYKKANALNPEAFAAAWQNFERRGPAAAIRTALQMGVRERLREMWFDPRLGPEAVARYCTHSHVEAVLVRLFPETAETFRRGIYFEMCRMANARIFSTDRLLQEANPRGENRMPSAAFPDRAAVSRARRMFKRGMRATEPERVAMIALALSPVTPDLIAGLPFPR